MKDNITGIPYSFATLFTGRGKYIAHFVAAGLIWAAASPLASGQVGPIMIIVAKNENRDTKSSYRCSLGHIHSSGADVASYNVDILNAGATTIKDVEIHWTVVTREPSGSQYRLTEGVQKTNLDRAQKFSFETDAVELATFSKGGYSGSSSTSRRAEVVGYLVEVNVDGKVVKSDCKPADIRTKIDRARASALQNSTPSTGTTRSGNRKFSR